jgi:hypothetical protein
MLVEETRHCNTLLGRKNVGKTQLLATFAKSVRKVVGSSLIIVNLSCDSDRQTPRHELCIRLNIRVDSEWNSINKQLSKKFLKVLFIIDEFNLVYTNLFKGNGEAYIREVLVIGGSRSGLYHCILARTESDEFTWVKLIDVDNIDPNLQSTLLLELADLGYLAFIEEGFICKIGFHSSRIYLAVSQ